MTARARAEQARKDRQPVVEQFWGAIAAGKPWAAEPLLSTVRQIEERTERKQKLNAVLEKQTT